MRLRRPCEHVEPGFPDGHYDGHVPIDHREPKWCNGGEFLPEDAIGLVQALALFLKAIDYSGGMTHLVNESPVSISLWVEDSFLETTADQVGEPG